MRVLILFSNPPGQPYLRLGDEDKILASLARQHEGAVEVERLHASEVEDIHTLMAGGDYDVVQFSGHGYGSGVVLQRSSFSQSAPEPVSAERLVALLALADTQPILAVFLSCYSAASLDTLVNAAPYVVTSPRAVTDPECLTFVQGFYERIFRNYSIQASFDHAIHLLTARNLPTDGFSLSRRALMRRGNSLLVESTPDPLRNSILVNLDQIQDKISTSRLSEEQLCHLLARKLAIHRWIFETARDHATSPIGSLLFGEFHWSNAADIVYCTRLMRFAPGLSRVSWEVWSTLLSVYNDLASLDYRRLREPAAEHNESALRRAVNLLRHNVNLHVVRICKLIEGPEAPAALPAHLIRAIVPHFQFVMTECARAEEQLDLGRFPQVVEALELALTNLHEIVSTIQPAEEEI